MIPLPKKVEGYRSTVLNGLIDYVSWITPRQSGSVRWSYSPGGAIPEVTSKLGSGGGAAFQYPFEVIESDTLKVQVRYGRVWLKGDEKTIVDVTWTNQLSQEFTVVPTSHTWEIWLAIDRENLTVTMDNGAALPANTDTVEYWLLATVTTNDDDTQVESIRQSWTGGDIRITLFG